MAKKSKSVSVLICSLVAVILTFAAPLLVRSIGPSLKYIYLFDGFKYPWVTVLLVVFGAGLILSDLVYLFSDSGKVVSLIRACSFFFLVNQILAIALSMDVFYSDLSLWGSIKSSIEDVVFSPHAVVACVFSLITFILSLTCPKR